MENLPSFVIIFNIAAATFPRFASGLGLIWAVARVFYHIGYASKGPSGRAKGSLLSGVAAFTLVIPP